MLDTSQGQCEVNNTLQKPPQHDIVVEEAGQVTHESQVM